MTGLIDLTYTVDGRWYVLDYKSNRLPSYDADALARAMAHSEYALQALIYTVALHRWLRFRLGEAYDYARDFGGVRYLFCRGLDAGRHAVVVAAASESESVVETVGNSIAGQRLPDSTRDSTLDRPAPAPNSGATTAGLARAPLGDPAPGIHAWRFEPALVQAWTPCSPASRQMRCPMTR